MTDRVLSALRGLGLQVPPLATLEREDGFFALLPDLLVYQDEQGTRRVTLRDLTRIHSDAEGMLRVETPAGTALTANLLGFEPGEVQGFFAGVRDATAQAKNLPAAPLPTAGGFKTFGSAPKSAAPPQPQPREIPQVKEAQTRETQPREPQVAQGQPVPAATVPEVQVVPEPAPPSPEPSRAVQTKAALPKFGQAKQAQGKPQSKQAEPPQREPVQTAKSGVTVVSADPGLVPPVPVAAAPVTPPPATPPPREAFPPVASSALAVDPAPAPVVAGSSHITELGARVAAVRGLPSRLQVLAVVLGLAAIGLAYFQYQDGAPLSGLWTLIAGGVGSVALFVFAEVTRLIVTLAGAVAQGRALAASRSEDAGA